MTLRAGFSSCAVQKSRFQKETGAAEILCSPVLILFYSSYSGKTFLHILVVRDKRLHKGKRTLPCFRGDSRRRYFDLRHFI